MTEPCENCLVLPICRNKIWHQVVDKCQLLTDYIIEETKEEMDLPSECPIHTLGKSYFVHYTSDTHELYISGYKSLLCKGE